MRWQAPGSESRVAPIPPLNQSNFPSVNKAGKVAALNFLKGQVMKLSKGKANPALAGEILERKLKA